MPYVQRNSGNTVIGIFANLQNGYAEEWLDDDSPELIFQAKQERISKLQTAYEVERDKLNKAWLSALIADGIGESTRQASIKIQMEELDTQLEMDILTIIMEE